MGFFTHIFIRVPEYDENLCFTGNYFDLNFTDDFDLLGRKTELDRMAAMLSRLGGRGYSMVESSAVYRSESVAVDPEDENPHQAASGDGVLAAPKP